jgi:hypothetical protein
LVFTLPIIAIGTVLALLFPVMDILHVAIPVSLAVVWSTAAAVTVSTVIVALATFALILARGVPIAGTTTRRRLAAAARGAATVAVAALVTTLTTGLETPGSRWRGTGPLNRVSCCQSVQPDNSPTSIFRTSSRPMRLLCISWYASSASRRLSYSTKAKLLSVLAMMRKSLVYKGRQILTAGWWMSAELGCHNGQGDHTFEDS